MCPIAAARIADSVDPNKTAPVLGLHCLSRLVCVKQTLDHHDIVNFSWTVQSLSLTATAMVLCPGFRLAAGKKGRFLYVFDRAGSQPAPLQLPACPGFRLAAGNKGRFLYVFDRAGRQYLHDNFGQRHISITRNAISPKSGQKDCRKF